MAAFIDRFSRYCGSTELAVVILINAGVFLTAWAAIHAGNAMGLEGNFTMQWLCVSSQVTVIPSRFWTLLTYMVTHYDIFHLLFNMLWLGCFGILRSPLMNGRRLVKVYVGGGLAGAALYGAVSAIWPSLTASGGYLCGSSASVLAVMTASAVFFPDRRINLFLFGSVRLKWVTAVCVALTLLGLGGGSQGAQSAHVGGVLFGIVFALVAGKKTELSKAAPSAIIRNPIRKVRINIRRNGDAVAHAAGRRLSDASRLDALLDKIRLSGYSSLSPGERNELNELSMRIDKMSDTKK